VPSLGAVPSPQTEPIPPPGPDDVSPALTLMLPLIVALPNTPKITGFVPTIVSVAPDAIVSPFIVISSVEYVVFDCVNVEWVGVPVTHAGTEKLALAESIDVEQVMLTPVSPGGVPGVQLLGVYWKPVMHVPFTQVSPAGHAEPVPHWQVPPAQVSVVPLQAGFVPHMQVPPVHVLLAPLQAGLVPQRQVPEEQVLDVPEHAGFVPQKQVPAVHVSLAPEHTGLVPHSHAPAAEQPLALVPHAVQAPPFVPQVVADGALHWPPAQQPDAHEVLSHTQCALLQCWPPAHAAPVPQAQAPEAAQESASELLQATHAAPPVPHSAAVGGFTHVVPLQHPAAHEVLSQTQVLVTQR
jgi:hypothetical protein